MICCIPIKLKVQRGLVEAITMATDTAKLITADKNCTRNEEEKLMLSGTKHCIYSSLNICMWHSCISKTIFSMNVRERSNWSHHFFISWVHTFTQVVSNEEEPTTNSSPPTLNIKRWRFQNSSLLLWLWYIRAITALPTFHTPPDRWQKKQGMFPGTWPRAQSFALTPDHVRPRAPLRGNLSALPTFKRRFFIGWLGEELLALITGFNRQMQDGLSHQMMTFQWSHFHFICLEGSQMTEQNGFTFVLQDDSRDQSYSASYICLCCLVDGRPFQDKPVRGTGGEPCGKRAQS